MGTQGDDELASEDEHEWDRMAAGLNDVTAAYLQEKGYPYKVAMVSHAKDLMMWTPGTVLIVLEPKRD